MEKHHLDSIEKYLEICKQDRTILAAVLGGSIAHGFEQPDSDIDILLIVEPDEYLKRKKENKTAFSIRDICNYENGYIDCKVTDIDFVKKVAENGSDAARFAFTDGKILFSRIEGLEDLLKKVAVYPKDKVGDRRKRFASQLLAWKWYYSEAVKKQNKYLVYLSVQKLVLFACRIILNENELLYPYHKWMLKVIETAVKKPENFLVKIKDVLESPSTDKVNELCEVIMNFIDFNEGSVDWPNYFLKDSEQNWLEHEPPIDDL